MKIALAAYLALATAAAAAPIHAPAGLRPSAAISAVQGTVSVKSPPREHEPVLYRRDEEWSETNSDNGGGDGEWHDDSNNQTNGENNGENNVEDGDTGGDGDEWQDNGHGDDSGGNHGDNSEWSEEAGPENGEWSEEGGGDGDSGQENAGDNGGNNTGDNGEWHADDQVAVEENANWSPEQVGQEHTDSNNAEQGNEEHADWGANHEGEQHTEGEGEGGGNSAPEGDNGGHQDHSQDSGEGGREVQGDHQEHADGDGGSGEQANITGYSGYAELPDESVKAPEGEGEAVAMEADDSADTATTAAAPPTAAAPASGLTAGASVKTPPAPADQTYSEQMEQRLNPDINPKTLDQKMWTWWNGFVGMSDDLAFDKFDLWTESGMSVNRKINPKNAGTYEWEGAMISRQYRQERFLGAKHTLEKYLGTEPGKNSRGDELWKQEIEKHKEKLLFQEEQKKAKEAMEGKTGTPTSTSKAPATTKAAVDKTNAPKNSDKRDIITVSRPPAEATKAVKTIFEELAFNLAHMSIAEIPRAFTEDAAAQPTAAVNAPLRRAEPAPPVSSTEDFGFHNIMEMVAAVIAAADRKSPDEAVDPHTLRRSSWTLANPPANPPGGDWNDLFKWIEACQEWRTAARDQQDLYAKMGFHMPDPPLIPAGQDWGSIMRWRQSAEDWAFENVAKAVRWENARLKVMDVLAAALAQINKFRNG